MNSINIKDKYYQEEKCGISKLYEEVKKGIELMNLDLSINLNLI